MSRTTSSSPIRRHVASAVALAATWVTVALVLGAPAAHAMRDPDTNGGTAAILGPTTVTIPEPTPFARFALVAVAACLLTVAATLAIQAIVRRSHHSHSVQVG